MQSTNSQPLTPQAMTSLLTSVKAKPEEFTSQKEVRYQRLRDLLATQQWLEAEEETIIRMYAASGHRFPEQYLESPEEIDIESIPGEDLAIINQLWLYYSKGRFGFSVQQEIYQSLVAGQKSTEDIWADYFDAVGWDGDWMYVPDISSPNGHLPNCDWLSIEGLTSLLARTDFIDDKTPPNTI